MVFNRIDLGLLVRPEWMPYPDALKVAVEALVDAAEDDVATGGPDIARKIFPIAVMVTHEGAEDASEEEVAAAVAAVIGGRS